MTACGAIFGWGCRGATLGDLERLVARHRVTRVIDIRQRRAANGFSRQAVEEQMVARGVVYHAGLANDIAVLGRIYSTARDGARILLLEEMSQHTGSARGLLMALFAREAWLYANSAMAAFIQTIDIAHIVNGKLQPVVHDPGKKD